MFNLIEFENALKGQISLYDKLQTVETDEYREIIESMMRRAERMNLSLCRALAFLSGKIPGSEQVSDPLCIKDIYACMILDGIQPAVQIDLPFLLPDRNSATQEIQQRILMLVRGEADKLCWQGYCRLFDRATVTFINYFSPGSEEKKTYDSGNIEINSVLSAIAGLLIPEDISMCCDLKILSREAQYTFTRIIIKENLLPPVGCFGM